MFSSPIRQQRREAERYQGKQDFCTGVTQRGYFSTNAVQFPRPVSANPGLRPCLVPQGAWAAMGEPCATPCSSASGVMAATAVRRPRWALEV